MMPLLDTFRIQGQREIPENGLPLGKLVPEHPARTSSCTNQPWSSGIHDRYRVGPHCTRGTAEAGIVVIHFLGEAAAA